MLSLKTEFSLKIFLKNKFKFGNGSLYLYYDGDFTFSLKTSAVLSPIDVHVDPSNPPTAYNRPFRMAGPSVYHLASFSGPRLHSDLHRS